MKTCPYCLDEVHEAAIVCPNCTSNLIITVPIGVLDEQNAMEQTRKRHSFIARVIFAIVTALLIACVVSSMAILWSAW